MSIVYLVGLKVDSASMQRSGPLVMNAIAMVLPSVDQIEERIKRMLRDSGMRSHPPPQPQSPIFRGDCLGALDCSQG
jgi:hypothetical protein